MKILYTPTLIVPSLDPGIRARILEAAGPGAVLVEARQPERQRAEIAEAEILFGRVPPDIYLLARRLRSPTRPAGSDRPTARRGSTVDG